MNRNAENYQKTHVTASPAFSVEGQLHQDEFRLAAQILAANLRYPIHEYVFIFLAIIAFEAWIINLDGVNDFVTVALFVAIDLIVAIAAVFMIGGEKAFLWAWRVASQLSHGKLPTGIQDVDWATSLRLYGNRIEWGNPDSLCSAGYGEISFALIYKNLLLVWRNPSYKRIPEIRADLSRLDEEEALALVHFLEKQVNAVRRTHEYRCSVPAGTDAKTASSRLACLLWRWTLAIVGISLSASGVLSLMGMGADFLSNVTATDLSFSIFLILTGASLLDGLHGRTLYSLRTHPIWRSLRISGLRTMRM